MKCITDTEITTESFKNLDDANGKLQQFIDAADLALAVYDRSALENFQQNPTFETAQAWGNKVGSIFDKLSNFVPELPLGWDKVLKGVLQTPQTVINEFGALVKKRYEMIDRETKDGKMEQDPAEGTMAKKEPPTQ